MSSRQTTSCYSGLSVYSRTIAPLPAVVSSVGCHRIAGLLKGVCDVPILQPSHQHCGDPHHCRPVASSVRGLGGLTAGSRSLVSRSDRVHPRGFVLGVAAHVDPASSGFPSLGAMAACRSVRCLGSGVRTGHWSLGP
jgi:hypothetical protein